MSRRAGLDRQTIVKAAAEVSDTLGLEQVTMARLANHLGVRTPSLYNHITGLADLHRELALYSTHELISCFTRAAVGKAGVEAILALADAYRSYAKAHPGRYALTQQPPGRDDPQWQAVGRGIIEVVLTVLTPYRLSEEDALHVVRGFRSIVHGFVMLEIAGGFGLPLDLDESFHRLIRVFINGLRQASNTVLDPRKLL